MTGETSGGADFRCDINGLRAWAVVAVVLYHFGVPGFNGGFIGVDVFFVISGFLMTGIVVRDLERGRFSLIGFYLARGRRIVPALAFLCAALLVIGWLVMLPPDYKLLGDHVISSLGFFSNFKYWDEAGYFDLASHDKWLLHTWSLSVEWQFYILLPIALWAAWRIRQARSTLTWVVSTGLVASLLISVSSTNAYPVTAFFLLHTRAWEMLAGGLVFLCPQTGLSPGQKRALECGGLLLILISIAMFDQYSFWPGWRATLPVAAAMAILSVNRVSLWTGNRIAQWLGSRSYSIYLWHWVVVVSLAYVGLTKSPSAVVAGALMTLLLGHLSWRWIETPARKYLVTLKPSRDVFALVSVVVVLGACALTIRLAHGVAGRFPAAIEAVAAEEDDTNPRRAQCDQAKGIESPRCVYGSGPVKGILLGDSHAEAVITAFASAAVNAQGAAIQWTYTGCPTIRNAKHVPGSWLAQKSGYDCPGFIDWTIRQLQGNYLNVPVVVFNRPAAAVFGDNKTGGNMPSVYFTKVYATPEPVFVDEFSHNMVSTLCELAQHRPVYVVRPIPEMDSHVPKTSSRQLAMGLPSDIKISLESYHQRQDPIWAAQDKAHAECGVKILDPLPYLCHNGFCYGSKDGKPLYYDSDHLNEFGNKLLVPMFAEVFKTS